MVSVISSDCTAIVIFEYHALRIFSNRSRPQLGAALFQNVDPWIEEEPHNVCKKYLGPVHTAPFLHKNGEKNI